MTLLSGNDPSYSSQDSISTQAPYCTLLVDDDRGLPDVETPYMNALNSGNYSYDSWDTQLQGHPDPGTLLAHQSVIWFTGTPWQYSLHPREEIALGTYLDGGGQLFLSSQDYLYESDRTDFNREYLGVGTFVNNTGTNLVVGAPGDPVGNGLGPYNFTATAPFSDNLTPLIPASGAFTDSGGTFNASTLDSGLWKTLFLAWPFENLTLPDGSELVEETMNWFNLPPNPSADFNASTMLTCIGETVSFTNQSQDATAYLWDFGDGNTSTLTHPTHSYTSAINANVILDGSNCCGMDTDSLTISVIDAPAAGFTTSETVGLVGETIIFTNTSTHATSDFWNFGDGSTSTDQNPTHIYSAPIAATITLTASNAACQGKPFTQTIQIQTSEVIYLPLLINKTTGSSEESNIWQQDATAFLPPLIGFSVFLAIPRRKK